MEGNPLDGGFQWRVSDLERRMGQLESLPQTAARMDERIVGMEKRLMDKIDALDRREAERDDDVNSLRRSLYLAAITFAGSGAALVFAAQKFAS